MIGWHGTIRVYAYCSPVDMRVAVGTGLSSWGSARPPHRSQRAELPHWAPTSGSTIEASAGPRMQDSRLR